MKKVPIILFFIVFFTLATNTTSASQFEANFWDIVSRSLCSVGATVVDVEEVHEGDSVVIQFNMTTDFYGLQTDCPSANFTWSWFVGYIDRGEILLSAEQIPDFNPGDRVYMFLSDSTNLIPVGGIFGFFPIDQNGNVLTGPLGDPNNYTFIWNRQVTPATSLLPSTDTEPDVKSVTEPATEPVMEDQQFDKLPSGDTLQKSDLGPSSQNTTDQADVLELLAFIADSDGSVPVEVFNELVLLIKQGGLQ